MRELISREQALAVGRTRYFSGKPCKNGHIAERMVANFTCVICLKDQRLDNLRRRRRERPGSLSDRDKRANQRHKDYKLQWARTVGKLAKKLDKQRRRAGPAMPRWADYAEIAKIYTLCPEGMVVDHIVPLFHYTDEDLPVCGLHVSWNLQYITQSKNAGKTPRDRWGWKPRLS